MPVVVTTLLALGSYAASVLARRARRDRVIPAADTDPSAEGVGDRPAPSAAEAAPDARREAA